MATYTIIGKLNIRPQVLDALHDRVHSELREKSWHVIENRVYMILQVAVEAPLELVSREEVENASKST